MNDNLLEPVWQADPSRWNDAMAAHLLRRAAFGGTLDEIDAFTPAGPRKAVDTLINYQTQKDDLPGVIFGELTAPNARAGAPALAGAGRGNQILQSLPDPQKRALQNIQQSAQRGKQEEIKLWWLDRMIRTKRPLEEKMTLFWHGLFVSSAVTVNNTWFLYKQNLLFRRFASGNYRVLTHEVSKDPAMLAYLNNNQNVKAHPNENYARELMELFTMGIGNYTEDDIKQSARSFTGFANAGDQFIFRPAQHDTGLKTFLGRTGNFTGDDIVDIIFQQPCTSRYIAKRLIKFFAADEPSTDIVEALAAVVRQHDFEMAPVLRALFASNWFYSREVMLRQIKSPTQLVVGSLRALGATMNQPAQVLNALRMMGQEIFMAPTVKGWDGGRSWINTSTLFARYNLPAYLGTGSLPANPRQTPAPGAKTDFADFNSGWNPQADLAAASIATTDAVVDLYIRKLLGFNLDPHKRDDLIEYINGTGDPRSHLHDPITAESDRRVRGLVHLIMAMAEYQLC